MKIIGRNREKALLKSYYESQHPEFVAVYGRRRTGKTFLIKEFFDNDFFFFCTGLANGTKHQQLQVFNVAMNKYGSGEYLPQDNWLDAFIQLSTMIENSPNGDKKVIFLDEMPWMDTPRSNFLIGLEYFWNSFASSRPDVLLIVCGSSTSWIVNKLFRNTGGLYNRVTKQMSIKPFTLGETEEFFQDRGITFNRYQMIESYMIFGGIPYYLDYFDNEYSLAQNVDMLCFGDTALLRNEYFSLYSTLFNDYENHHKVVEALSLKSMGLTREELITATGLSNGGGFSRILKELEQSGFINTYAPFSRKSRGSLYQLTDSFTLFYHKFMKKGNRDAHFWTSNIDASSHRAWSGYAFEQVCFSHIEQIKEALKIAIVASNVSAWRSTSATKGTQIDLVIDRRDQVINLCEIKYSMSEYSITKAYDQILRERRATFREETKTKKALHTTMITPYGVKHNEYWNSIQSEVTMEDLFK
ncbi:MAG: AAA family ATPase [Clostridiales Family XIII bacterium]|jgi:AAA+ ATPase superfamily predicted ATPase|nr:AAA family ATPase [Clostridiales Family XIII bacterium]